MTHSEFIQARVVAAIAEGGPFVIEAAAQNGLYVQGGLTRPGSLYLEAVDLDRQGTGELTPEQVSSLAALGFARGEQNFAQILPVPSPEAAPALAANLLTQVFEILGVPEGHPLRSDNELSSSWLDVRHVRGTPYPPYVQSGDQRRRWNWAHLIAAGMSMSGSGAVDTAFLWDTAHSIYNDETFVDDGTDEDFASAVTQARDAGLIPDEDSFY
jgi:hypothetical protein